MSGMQAAVRVRGLRKVYSGRAVVDGVELDIAPGECFALLGPNGAGKTTTVEILEGFRSRDAGEVAVLGVDPAHADRVWRCRLGVVGQGIGAALELTVSEALRHFAVYHADPRDTDELLTAVGLTESADVRIPNLSGGQRRRLDVALGVQGRPDVLFLDEPTTGLDPAARRQFWTLLEKLRAEGTTIVLTTHYLDEAAHLADRVAVISHGRLLETAPPDRLGAAFRSEAVVHWTEDGTAHAVRTATPTATVRELCTRQPGGEIPDLAVVRPSLEDVYLAMLEAADGPVAVDEAVATEEAIA
jgi:ABC-2 type transport system ATP-binding protein